MHRGIHSHMNTRREAARGRLLCRRYGSKVINTIVMIQIGTSLSVHLGSATRSRSLAVGAEARSRYGRSASSESVHDDTRFYRVFADTVVQVVSRIALTTGADIHVASPSSTVQLQSAIINRCSAVSAQLD